MKESPLLPGSPQQEAIWDFLLNGKEHGLVESRAGVGKTFSVTQGALRVPKTMRVGIFSFNKHIIEEINGKLRDLGIYWVRATTYHSFGYAAVRRTFRDAKLMEDKLAAILGVHVNRDDRDPSLFAALSKLVQLCKDHLDEGTDADVLEGFVEKHSIDLPPELNDEVFGLVPRVLQECLDWKGAVDFDDQIWWTVQLNLPVQKFADSDRRGPGCNRGSRGGAGAAAERNGLRGEPADWKMFGVDTKSVEPRSAGKGATHMNEVPTPTKDEEIKLKRVIHEQLIFMKEFMYRESGEAPALCEYARCTAECVEGELDDLLERYGDDYLYLASLAEEMLSANEVPVFSIRFQAMFNDFNACFFGGQLPTYDVQAQYIPGWVPNDPSIPVVGNYMLPSTGELDHRLKLLRLGIEEDELMTHYLLHFMAHIAAGDDSHGPEFEKEMDRLRSAGAPLAGKPAVE
ncbi:MAG: hypothetical protein DMG57_41585 [Acidobacteria bacterium]|nr:MAG: hypothetical protein DMG57_41585 [Acidobacteriota bacterium]